MKTDETIQKREAIAYELEQLWGRKVSAQAVSRFIDSTIDPLPARRIRRRVLVMKTELEEWARRQVSGGLAVGAA